MDLQQLINVNYIVKQLNIRKVNFVNYVYVLFVLKKCVSMY